MNCVNKIVFLGQMSIAAMMFPIAANASETGVHAGEAEHGPHIVELFLGVTSADHNGHTQQAGSVGASYRYAFNHTVSAGVLAEYTGGALDDWVVGIPVVFNLGHGGWQGTLMPGFEITSSHEEPLFRVGLGYEFEFDGYSLKPELNVDFVDGETVYVLGVSLGFRF
ncbi:hypothetical protein Q8W37_08595 [Shimia thalassica]|uniref:hypothetical protein n=1 Tax=Shimia thalassica TaxID=1715693 RepID=UPI0027330500|nr:hypothetical protein [Shimia thalassica]MDP2579987.1 hypothetical protein [Shimia thalassica]